MPGNRGKAISTLARWVDDTGHALLEGHASESFVEGLGAIKGIGPWTQNYMRLRVVKDVNAFPHNDWGAQTAKNDTGSGVKAGGMLVPLARLRLDAHLATGWLAA